MYQDSENVMSFFKSQSNGQGFKGPHYKYDNGKMVHPMSSSYQGQMSGRNDPVIKKRYMGFNAYSRSRDILGTGHDLDRFLEAQLALLPEEQMGFVDPMTIKKDSPLTTGDSAAYNAIFGAQAIIQVVQSANALNALPHTVWPSSGFRAVSSPSHSSGVGVAQSSDRPATLEPTYQELSIPPKEIAGTTELSDVLVELANTDDVVTFEVNREIVHSNFMDAWDTDLLVDGDTAPGNNFESIDRVTATDAYATALSWTDGGGVVDTELHGMDPGSYSWWDAGGTSHDSGSDRYLSTNMLNLAIATTQPYWVRGWDRENILFLTKYDTQAELENLEDAKQFITSASAQFDVGGVMTQEGADVGVPVSKYKHVPIIQDPNVVADDIGRIHLVNTEYLNLSFGRPLEVLGIAG